MTRILIAVGWNNNVRMVKPKLFWRSHQENEQSGGDSEGGQGHWDREGEQEENHKEQQFIPKYNAKSMKSDLSIVDSLSLDKKKYDSNDTISRILRRYAHIICFFVYLFVGTLFYNIHPGNGAGSSPSGVLGFYQSILIGFSVGLSPRDPDYM